jgi:hypothetical protein
MTFHGQERRWKADGTLDSVGRGQEFVARPQDERNAVEWIAALLSESLQ